MLESLAVSPVLSPPGHAANVRLIELSHVEIPSGRGQATMYVIRKSVELDYGRGFTIATAALAQHNPRYLPQHSLS
jgi:hypothetical protein